MRYFKNIIAGGCSFTAHTLGGRPPTQFYVGENDYSNNSLNPNSWASFVAADLKPQSFINLASGGSGNIVIANSIIDCFSRYNYEIDNTLLLFNLSGWDRYDLICDWHHPECSDYVQWNKDILPYAYIGHGKPLYEKIRKELGFNNIEHLITNFTELFLTWLDTKKINYTFTLMSEIDRNIFNKVISTRKDKLVTFGEIMYMREYALSINQTYPDHQHPNQQGHRQIADYAIEKIKNLYLQ